MGRGGPVHAHKLARGAAGGRPPGGVGHSAHTAHRRALARRARRVRTGHHDLQPVQQVVTARLLACHAGRLGRGRLDCADGGHRQHLHQGASLRPRRQRGAKNQAIGPSRGGPTTKIHVLSDVLGRPAVVHLTPGNASDVRTAPAVLAAAPGRIRRLLADKGYDADWLRAHLRASGIVPVIPGTRSRKRPIRHDKLRY